MSIAVSHRPDPDELAAFIDGQLSGEERRKLEIHLGTCEACREVVAESLALLEDVPDEAADAEPRKAKVLTHPAWHRAAWQVAPLAAAALLTILLWPTLTGLLYGPVSIDELNPEGVATGLDDDWTAHGWARFRGSWVENLSPEQIAFRLGALVVDLQVAFRAGDETDRLSVLDELIVLLQDGVDFATPLQLRYEQIRDSMAATPAEPQLEEIADVEEDLEAFLDSDYFFLGKWAEVGRLATMIGDHTYFGKRSFRSSARKLERSELRPELTEEVRRIRDLAEGLSDASALSSLRDAFDKMINKAG